MMWPLSLSNNQGQEVEEYRDENIIIFYEEKFWEINFIVSIFEQRNNSKYYLFILFLQLTSDAVNYYLQ